MDWQDTGLWSDVLELPNSLEATIGAADGWDGVAESLRGARRVIVSGNGAAYYVGHALWLASLESAPGPEVVAVPAGLLARGFRFRDGDRLLGVSSSGEFRDLVEALPSAPRPIGAITAKSESSLATGADAVALQTVLGQRAVTHTQALAGAIVAALGIWARVVDDADLAAVVETAPAVTRSAIAEAEAMIHPVDVPTAAIAFGPGPAWTAALEVALCMKEIACVPTEGCELREGATTAMFGLAPGHLAIALALRGDDLLGEAEDLCRGQGAAVVRMTGAATCDPRLAVIATIPETCALTARLAIARGLDVDKPAWLETYYRTARAKR